MVACRVKAPYAAPIPQPLPDGADSERAQQHVAEIQNGIIPGMDFGAQKLDGSDDFDITFTEKLNEAESIARQELGESYRLVEMGEQATIDCLLNELAVQERLDAMVEKCLKRLL